MSIVLCLSGRHHIELNDVFGIRIKEPSPSDGVLDLKGIRRAYSRRRSPGADNSEHEGWILQRIIFTPVGYSVSTIAERQ
jgi:hypothetical protein